MQKFMDGWVWISLEANLINNYCDKYMIYECGKEMDEILGINNGPRNKECEWYKECKFEFLANLNENNAKILKWFVANKYFNQTYNDQIKLDKLQRILTFVWE